MQVQEPVTGHGEWAIQGRCIACRLPSAPQHPSTLQSPHTHTHTPGSTTVKKRKEQGTAPPPTLALAPSGFDQAVSPTWAPSGEGGAGAERTFNAVQDDGQSFCPQGHTRTLIQSVDLRAPMTPCLPFPPLATGTRRRVDRRRAVLLRKWLGTDSHFRKARQRDRARGTDHASTSTTNTKALKDSRLARRES